MKCLSLRGKCLERERQTDRERVRERERDRQGASTRERERKKEEQEREREIKRKKIIFRNKSHVKSSLSFFINQPGDHIIANIVLIKLSLS